MNLIISTPDHFCSNCQQLSLCLYNSRMGVSHSAQFTRPSLSLLSLCVWALCPPHSRPWLTLAPAHSGCPGAGGPGSGGLGRAPGKLLWAESPGRRQQPRPDASPSHGTPVTELWAAARADIEHQSWQLWQLGTYYRPAVSCHTPCASHVGGWLLEEVGSEMKRGIKRS